MKHLCLIYPFLPCKWSGRSSANAYRLCWLLPSKLARNRCCCTKSALSSSSLPRRGISLGKSASQNRWFCSWFTHFSQSYGIRRWGDTRAFRVSPSFIQKDTLSILSFSVRREGGSSFQALQKHHGMRNAISSGSMACLLKCSGHFSIIVV